MIVTSVNIVNSCQAGDGVGEVIVTTGWMIDRVPSAAGGTSFEGGKLINQVGVIWQCDAFGIN
jgi:hypothetical protein